MRLAAALLALCLTSGCAGPGTPTEIRPGSAPPPVPVDATELATPPSVAPLQTQDCDATASLRPAGALPEPGQMPDGSTMAKILARGRLIAGVDQNTYLMGFRNSFTGEIEGFDVDLARRIAQAIFGDPAKVQFKIVTSAERIPALERGEVDIVARTMTVTCERVEKVNFSAVYYEAGQRVMVRRNSGITGVESLGGRKVCATNGSTSLANVAATAGKPTVVSVPNWTDCLVMLQQAQVDAISTDDTILAGLAAQDPYTEVVGSRFTEEPYGLGIPKGNEDFVRFVNSVLEGMRADGSWTALYQRWLGTLGPAPTPPAARYRD